MANYEDDRALLLFLLAVQNDLVPADDAVSVANAWSDEGVRPLAEVLEGDGLLSETRRALIEPLVDELIKIHEGDPERALASLGSLSTVLDRIGSAAIATRLRESMVRVGAAAVEKGQEATADFRQGESNGHAPRVSNGSRFRRVRSHAKGGLGEVFVAHDGELHREVALKEIQNRFADDPRSRGHFLLEAEITGGLEHPGIVPVYGLGSYPDGRPFYAMRFIRGESLKDAIADFRRTKATAADHEIGLRRLLRRFLDVCNAIAYAHSRGVLHRDLKPGNIMVGKYGETLVVDWGLAKLIDVNSDHDSNEVRLSPPSMSGLQATTAGSSLGTPVYMPPEQASGRVDLHSPRSDVYGLGATLYHVLTGRALFDGSNDRDVILNRVCKGDFPRPRAVAPEVPRGLEAICLKAMSLSPEDRYATPLELAADIEAWLADEPIVAMPDTAAMKMARWLRQNRQWARSGAAALLIISVTATLAAILINQARRSELDQKEIANNRRIVAEKRLAQLGEANQILGSIFRNLDPTRLEREDRPLAAILGDELENASRQLQDDAIGDPLTVARMQVTLGRAQLGLGHASQAIALFIKARDTLLSLLRPEDPELLATLHELARGYREAGNVEKALPIIQEVVKVQTETLGPDDPRTLTSSSNLASCLHDNSQFKEAVQIAQRIAEARKRLAGPENPQTLTSLSDLANFYDAAGEHEKAIRLNQSVWETKKKVLGDRHTSTLDTLNNLALSHLGSKNLERAIPFLEATFADMKAKLGEDHPITLSAHSNLGAAYYESGKRNEAIKIFEDVIERRRKKLGVDHPKTLLTQHNLAMAYFATGQVPKALTLMEETIASKNRVLGKNHVETLHSKESRASMLKKSGRFAEVLPINREVLAAYRETLGLGHRSTEMSVSNLRHSYMQLGMPKEHRALLLEVVDASSKELGPNHPYTITYMNHLANVYFNQKEVEKSIATHREMLERIKVSQGVESDDYGRGLKRLAAVMLDLKRYDEAEPLLRQGLAIRQKAEPNLWSTFETMSQLGECLGLLKKSEEGERMLIEGYQGLMARANQIPSNLRSSLRSSVQRLRRHSEDLTNPDDIKRWNEVLARVLKSNTPSMAKPKAQPPAPEPKAKT